LNLESPLKVLGISISKYKNSATNSIEPGQTAWAYRLTWLYTVGKGL
jgi:hypothetical protein